MAAYIFYLMHTVDCPIIIQSDLCSKQGEVETVLVYRAMGELAARVSIA